MQKTPVINGQYEMVHMKRCSTSLASREMQIKTPLTCTRMAIMERQDTCW